MLTYGTETWAMKEANLENLERTERMMVRWMCWMSLKDRKRNVDLYSLLGVVSVTEVVRLGRLRWFGHVECKSGDEWVSTCRNVVVAGVRCVGRGRKTWRECVKDDMDELGLHSEWTLDSVHGYGEKPHIGEKRLTLASVEEMDVLKINDDDEAIPYSRAFC